MANLIGHFTGAYDYWSNPGVGFDRIESVMNIGKSGDADGYYYALQAWFKASSASPTYIGLQSSGGHTSPHVGKRIAIFSVWDTTSGFSPEYAAPFGGEGIGFSTRITYPWIEGRDYRTSIVYGGPAPTPGFVWWGGFVRDLVTNVETLIGWIETPADRGKLISSTFFHERYVGGNTVASVVPSECTFYRPEATAAGGGVSRTSTTQNCVRRNKPDLGELYGFTSYSDRMVSVVGTKPAPAPAPVVVAPPAPVVLPPVVAPPVVVPPTPPTPVVGPGEYVEPSTPETKPAGSSPVVITAEQVLRQRLIEWVESEDYELDNIVYRSDASDVIDHADVIWPDDSLGTHVTTSLKTVDYAHLVTGFVMRHADSGTVITQRPKQLNLGGLLVSKPPLLFNELDVAPATWRELFARYPTARTWAELFALVPDAHTWRQLFGMPALTGGFGVTPFGSTPFGA